MLGAGGRPGSDEEVQPPPEQGDDAERAADDRGEQQPGRLAAPALLQRLAQPLRVAVDLRERLRVGRVARIEQAAPLGGPRLVTWVLARGVFVLPPPDVNRRASSV